jgi:hypothetical protein
MQALELLAFDRRLEGEVEVGERLDHGEARGPHRRLEPPGVAQVDVGAQEPRHGLAPREFAGIAAPEDVVHRLERPGHLEVGELRAELLANRGGRRGQPGGAHEAPPTPNAA